MAPQKRLRPTPLDDPPTASSSDDDQPPSSKKPEDEVVDEEEDDSSEEEGEENDQNEEDEDEDEGSESESESDSEQEPTPKRTKKEAPSLALSEMCKFSEALGLSSLNKDAIRRGMDLMVESKVDEFDEEWRKVQIAEMELFVTRWQLLTDQASILLDAMKKE